MLLISFLKHSAGHWRFGSLLFAFKLAREALTCAEVAAGFSCVLLKYVPEMILLIAPVFGTGKVFPISLLKVILLTLPV